MAAVKKILTDLDYNGNKAVNFAVESLASPPVGMDAGRIIFDSTKKEIVFGDGNVNYGVTASEIFTEQLISDFEGGAGSFVFVSGENGFVVGTNNPSTGTQSMYASSNGKTNAYTNMGGGIDVSYAYIDVLMPDAANNIILQFDYLCEAETGFDYGTFHDIPTSTTPVVDVELGAVGSTPLIEYTDQLTWVTTQIVIPIGEANTTRRLCWGFKSNNTVENNPPMNVDNIKLLYN